MNQKNKAFPKIMVGCRLPSDLREKLETEAYESEMTLSAYLEYVLNQWINSDQDDDEEEDSELIDQYNELSDELNELSKELESVRQAKAEISFHWLTPATGQKVGRLLERLLPTFPERKAEEILLGSLEVAALNSKNNFFTYAIQDYFENPEWVENPNN